MEIWKWKALFISLLSLLITSILFWFFSCSVLASFILIAAILHLSLCLALWLLKFLSSSTFSNISIAPTGGIVLAFMITEYSLHRITNTHFSPLTQILFVVLWALWTTSCGLGNFYRSKKLNETLVFYGLSIFLIFQYLLIWRHQY